MPEKTPEYLLLHHAQHLCGRPDPCGRLPHLQPPPVFMEMVSNGWRLAWERKEVGYRGFASDTIQAWKAIEKYGTQHPAAGPLPFLGAQLRCMLCLSSITSIGSNIAPELLAAAVKSGVLSGRQALDLVEIKTNSSARGRALTVLAPHLPKTLLAEALEAVRAIVDEGTRCESSSSRSR